MLFAVLAVGCGKSLESPWIADSTEEKVSVEEFKTRLESIASWKTGFEIRSQHEGLPHQHTDPQYTTEKKRDDVFAFSGYLFYSSPITIDHDKAEQLSELLLDPVTYRRWLGEKECDGFHPDWSVELQVGGTSVRFLICFGCNEAKIVFPDMTWRFDLSDSARNKIKSLLSAHHQNLPESSRSPY